MFGDAYRPTATRGVLPLFLALLGFVFLPSRVHAQDEVPVTRAQFENNLRQGLYSYEIKEFTRGERLAVGAWNGFQHPVLRWARTGQNDQRFVFMPEAGGTKVRIQTLREDVHDRIFVGITPQGGAITWPRADDNSQVFQLDWQADGTTFGLRAGLRYQPDRTAYTLRAGAPGEFLQIDDLFGTATLEQPVHGPPGDRESEEERRRSDETKKPKTNQLFELLNPREFAAILPTDHYYRLTTQWRGAALSLDILNDGQNNRPVLDKTVDVAGQSWKLTPADDGYYRLTTQWLGEDRSLDILNDGRNNRPILAKTAYVAGQLWKFRSLTGGYYRLSTQWRGEEYSLDIMNDGQNNLPILTKTADVSGQFWKLTQFQPGK